MTANSLVVGVLFAFVGACARAPSTSPVHDAATSDGVTRKMPALRTTTKDVDVE